jgi:hypothetical protein
MRDPDYGIIILLDALGVRALNIEEADLFLQNLDSLEETMNKALELYPELPSPDGEKIERPELRVFGDTLLLTYKIQPEYHQLLTIAGLFARKFVALGTMRNVKLRGAISIGSYYVSGNKVIGPAIADAASWYEIPDFIGVIATPTAGLYLSALNEQKTSQGIDFNAFGCWTQYPVPIKNNARKDMWTITWPYEYIVEQRDNIASIKKTPKQFLLNKLCYPEVPYGTESKYENTIQFFDWCEAEEGLLALAKKRVRL